ncbi:MAG: hypothetical protein E7664_00640 [Ruminococcaceae bacterium]|nr:hypothetical protein [Oscillospiraceae bacterium]
MEKKERSAGWRTQLLRTLDVNAEELPFGWSAELHGRDGVTLYGRGRILHYAETCIVLSLHGCVMKVRGQGLCCVTYRQDTVRIEGRISALEMEDSAHGTR